MIDATSALTPLSEAMYRGDLLRVAECLDAAKNLNLFSQEEIRELQCDVAEWFVEQGAIGHGIAILTQAYEAEFARAGHESPLVAQLADRLVCLYQEQGLPREALQLLEQIVQPSTSVEGPDSGAVQWRLQQCAIAMRSLGMQQEAAELQHAIDENNSEAATRRIGKPRTVEPTAPSSNIEFELINVFFATNRAPTGRSNPYDFFRGKRAAALTFGVATVSVPRNREVGDLPTPPRWLNEERANQAHYFVLKRIDSLDDAKVFESHLEDALLVSKRKEVLLFVHGFNTSFAAAALRAAQLGVDLEIDGAIALFSWPSKGSMLSYLKDRNELLKDTIEQLRDLIGKCLISTGAEKLHIVAHSMGCEFALQALESLRLSMAPTLTSSPPCVIDEVVFASPDVNATDMASRLPAIATLSSRLTVYSSGSDFALTLSGLLYGEERAGRKLTPAGVLGIDCIDTSASKADILGHGDYSATAIDDLRAIVWFSLPTSKRRFLSFDSASQRWLHNISGLTPRQSEAYREALIWARRVGVDDAVKSLSKLITGPVANAQASAHHDYRSLLVRELRNFG